MSEWKPTAEYLEEAESNARKFLLAMSYQLLSPVGKKLVDALNASEPVPDNVVYLENYRRSP